MKKSLFFLILFSLASQSLHSQNWFSNDDQWVFRNYEWMFEGYSEVSITGDTTINGVPCKKMFFDAKNVTYQWGDSINNQFNEYVYEKNDSIFYLNEFDEFKLIYDFTMLVGDTLTIYGMALGFDCQEPTYYILDSLSTMITGLDTFKVQHLTFVDTHWDYTQEIEVVESIGSTTGTFFRPRRHVCAFDIGGLSICSFKNQNNEYKLGEEDCYFLPVSVDPEILTDPISIYPNPAKNYIYVDIEQRPDVMELYDLNGLKMGIYTGTSSINVSAFPEGIYLLKISRGHKHIFRKIMVH